MRVTVTALAWGRAARAGAPEVVGGRGVRREAAGMSTVRPQQGIIAKKQAPSPCRLDTPTAPPMSLTARLFTMESPRPVDAILSRPSPWRSRAKGAKSLPEVRSSVDMPSPLSSTSSRSMHRRGPDVGICARVEEADSPAWSASNLAEAPRPPAPAEGRGPAGGTLPAPAAAAAGAYRSWPSSKARPAVRSVAGVMRPRAAGACRAEAGPPGCVGGWFGGSAVGRSGETSGTKLALATSDMPT
mmetsp:Transcript_8534/g.33755  ORF Transcript_8534/g.33755 Transcript_8534/m.33755 type:complete len:243 (-) Transcript_8534:2109-2837(-)